MLLNDQQIWDLIQNKNMIEPAVDHLVSEVDGRKVISYGLSSAGYDIRVGCEFYIFHNLRNGVIDPKDFNVRNVTQVSEPSSIIIPPNSFALAESIEYIRMPEDVVGIVEGKSTYARCGIITNVTPLEPGWEGNITLEISNTTPLPAKIYVGEGLCQVRFHKIERPGTTYADRKGKYQYQTGITLPRV